MAGQEVSRKKRGGLFDNRGSTGNLGLYVLDEDLREMGVWQQVG